MDVQMLENHWLACMATLGGGGRVTRLGGAIVVVNPQTPGMFANFISLRGVDPDRLEPVLEMGAALLAGESRLPALFLSPAAGNADELSDRLTGLGWRRLVRQAVLARSLPLKEAIPVSEAVTVSEIGPEQLPVWERVLARGYEAAPGVGEEVAAAWGTLLEQPGDCAAARYYLASLDGEPAGTGLTWLRGETAGLYCGAVLPALRRRGVERATLVRRLQDAAASGAYLALLQTDSGSPVEHLCLSHLGFQTAYHRDLWALPIRW